MAKDKTAKKSVNVNELVELDSPKDAINKAKLYKKLSKMYRKRTGFTNRLAVYLVLLLTFSLVLGFILAMRSIDGQYTGALICWSCVVCPLDTCLGIVLTRVVEKSRAENVSADGTGISYAIAHAQHFREQIEAYGTENGESMYTTTTDYNQYSSNTDNPSI